ncbi:MAG: HDOD domain-containing protein [Nitrosomonadales bacterium]|nr:HDOD domain-containing protein [Nitrosomonadales bacterium]
MRTNITELVQDVGNLVTLPDVFVRITRLLEDPDSSTADIARTVAQDPAFTLRLLRIANSSFYGFPSAIDTVAKAISMIGTGQVRSLALATNVAESFKGLPNTLVSMENFWKHSLYCALIARSLAKQAGRCDPDALFTAGLLHDIGELVLFNRMPLQARYALLLVLDSGDELPVYQAERQIMGFDHAQVGGELARQWQLPEMLVECIEHHHEMPPTLRYPREVALVHIANSLALMAELNTQEPDDAPPVEPNAWSLTGLDPDAARREIIAEVQTSIAEAEKLFLGRAS